MTEEDKKEIKGYMQELSKDFGKQIAVYIEEVNHKFEATSEQSEIINEKLDSHTKTLEEIAKDVTLIKVRAGDHENRIADLEAKV